ncbi:MULTISPECIES: GNAT family N-acetyltransferase [unclassified Microbacterium]|uniref:GNAT family N-acetyltransferase n=1 Tax=unclassified Microbacterium TaxID=2609290 RepID=UPI0012F85602|nr:GNAT family N-acetyltransferase [Microbacterium sp. MAH-37]MVQ41156.1 GNAT family N-acetyltransferase [Microbacterium sp. MAH-37]
MTTIAPITPADLDEWLPLWNGYLTFYEAALDAEITAATFERLVDPASGIHGAFARDDDGTAIGVVHWLTHPATWTTTDYCYLEDLFVAPDARGTGAGRLLIEHVRDWAEEHGSAKVYWLTAESNATARALYDRVASHSGMIQYQIKTA